MTSVQHLKFNIVFMLEQIKWQRWSRVLSGSQQLWFILEFGNDCHEQNHLFLWMKRLPPQNIYLDHYLVHHYIPFQDGHCNRLQPTHHYIGTDILHPPIHNFHGGCKHLHNPLKYKNNNNFVKISGLELYVQIV